MTARIRCSKHIDEPCPREAVELLLVRSHGSTTWNVRPRCDQHSAADDIPLLRHVTPGIEHAIVPLPRDVQVRP